MTPEFGEQQPTTRVTHKASYQTVSCDDMSVAALGTRVTEVDIKIAIAPDEATDKTGFTQQSVSGNIAGVVGGYVAADTVFRESSVEQRSCASTACTMNGGVAYLYNDTHSVLPVVCGTYVYRV
ncbi:hypothetical protein J6590_013022 [Homalodisca vitripennis]|nr:hypothetical protein J6590_013022 [Homalodisca vitripennis]